MCVQGKTWSIVKRRGQTCTGPSPVVLFLVEALPWDLSYESGTEQDEAHCKRRGLLYAGPSPVVLFLVEALP